MLTNNIFCVNDKAIYDALNQGKVTKQDLIDIFLSRGIIISPKTPKKKLAEDFSRRFHDYQDYKFLAEIFSVTSKRERTKVNYLKSNDLNDELVAGCLEELSDSITEIDEAKYEFEKTSSGFKVHVKYRQVNFNRSEFRQVDDKVGDIYIEKNKDGYSFRMPANKTFDAILERLVNKLNEDEEILDEVKIDEISLTGITLPYYRSLFFQNLVNNLEDMERVDVSDVFVYHPEVESKKLSVDDFENAIDEDGDESSDGSLDDESIGSTGVYISKASLKGKGVLNSDELSDLHDKGFYIWRIVWKSKFKFSDSDHYEFEAQFSEPFDCSDFSYMTKGAYKYKGKGEYNETRSRIEPPYDEQFFNKKVEDAANISIQGIIQMLRRQGDES